MSPTVRAESLPPTTSEDPKFHRLNVIRDVIAGALVVLGLLLPWNLHAGITIGLNGWLATTLIMVTLGSLVALVFSHAGPLSITAGEAPTGNIDRLRQWCNIPYFVVVAAFVAFAVVQSVSTGGTVAVPPGVGPGLWIGLAGALLAAQPVMRPDERVSDRRNTRFIRLLVVASLLLGSGATLFNVYWRTRYLFPDVGDPDIGTQNLVVIVTALMYGVVALLPLIVVGRWMWSAAVAARVATVLLAVSVLTAGLAVWLLPVGRDLDAFHGVAQNTSTAGVGYEGYVAWVAVAAIVGPTTIAAVGTIKGSIAWRDAARKCLLLIAVWCAGTAFLRIADLLTSTILDLPAPPYNATALMAADLLAAVVAFWLYVNTSSKAAPRLLTVLGGVVFVVMVCRLVLGIALVPRIQPLNPTDITDVYGNTLAQQITSTFDVALAVLSLLTLVTAFAGMRSSAGSPTTARERPQHVVPGSQSLRAPDEVWSAPTTALSTRRTATAPTIALPTQRDAAAPTTAIPVATALPPRIAQSGQSAPRIAPTPQDAPRIATPGSVAGNTATARIARSESQDPPHVSEVLAESTQQFAAGTTYGGSANSDGSGHR